MIFVEDGDIHMLKGRLVGLWMVDVEGGHWRGDFSRVRMGCSRTMGICLYTVLASLFQCSEPLMSSRIFSAAG